MRIELRFPARMCRSTTPLVDCAPTFRPGSLTYGAVFEVMPFDNRLVAFHLTGAELRTVLATQISRVPALVGVSGLRLRVTCERGAVNVGMLRPNGTPVADTDRLLVATTDFLATGGDNIFVPVTPPERLRNRTGHRARTRRRRGLAA